MAPGRRSGRTPPAPARPSWRPPPGQSSRSPPGIFVDISWASRHYFRVRCHRPPRFLSINGILIFRRSIQHVIAAYGDYTMRIRAILSYLCIASLAGGLAFAAPPGQIRVQVNIVNLFATVREKHKAISAGLRQDDFQVYEDGQPQEITYFSAESNLPITLGILLDTSGSEYFMLSGEKEAGSRFLARVLRKGDLAMVMTFDTDVDLLADFTDDRGVLDRAINRAQINAPSGGMIAQGPLPSSGTGGTNFYDAVYLAAHDKLSDEAGRKAIIVLTDAEDNGSKVSELEAIETAQRTDTVVHILLVAQDGGDQYGAK